ncbi:MAG: thiamine diphosphokinase [Pseudomonadota bacterium]
MTAPAAPVVTSGDPVTLVGGAPFAPATLAAAVDRAPALVAADSGASQLIEAGRTPQAVIGDMDSVQAGHLARLPDTAIHTIAEQDSTDFEKCLIRIAAPLVLAVGFTGRRIDHELAVLSVLARRAAHRCVVLGERDAIVLAPPRLQLDLDPGRRVSLFPLAPVRGTSTGLHWRIDALAFDPLRQIGTSNRATGPVALTFDAPHMLLILPAPCLDALLEGLETAPGWPAP